MTLDLDELERVAKAATPGPWFEANVTVPVMLIGGPARGYVASIRIEQIGGGAIAKAMEEERHANATHIATFNPAAVLALLARARDAERLGLALERLRAASSRANVRRVIADRVDEYPEDFDPGDRQEIRDMLADANAELCAAEAAAADLLSALNEGGPANG